MPVLMMFDPTAIRYPREYSENLCSMAVGHPGKFTGCIDESGERSWWVLSAGIIQRQRRQPGRAVFQHLNKPPRSDILSHIGFHDISHPGAVLRSDADQTRFVKRERPLNIDLDWLAVFLEAPAKQGIVGEARSEAAKPIEIARNDWPAMDCQEFRRGDDRVLPVQP